MLPARDLRSTPWPSRLDSLDQVMYEHLSNVVEPGSEIEVELTSAIIITVTTETGFVHRQALILEPHTESITDNVAQVARWMEEASRA